MDGPPHEQVPNGFGPTGPGQQMPPHMQGPPGQVPNGFGPTGPGQQMPPHMQGPPGPHPGPPGPEQYDNMQFNNMPPFNMGPGPGPQGFY